MPYSGTLIQAKERTERTHVMAPPEQTSSASPDYRCSAYRDQIDDVVMMREVYGGTKTMRAAGEKYLPRHPMESDAKWRVRQGIAVAFNGLQKTVSGLIGMIFRRAPTLSEDFDDEIAGHMYNIDMRGQDITVFGRASGEAAMLDGHTWIHVDAPQAGGASTRAQEAAAGIRPYWIHVKKSQAINWRYILVQGRPVLTLFVYKESAVEADGAFGEIARERRRVLRSVIGPSGPAVRGELWELRDKQGEKSDERRWVRIEEYAVEVDEIPVVCVYADRSGIFMSDPPLRDLAYEQAEHYRVRSERQKALTFSSIAVPYLFGREVVDADGNPKMAWGSDGMLLNNDPETHTGFSESHGYGLDALNTELAEVQARMAALGLQQLLGEPGTQPTTATEKLLDKTESDASLVLFAHSLERALNEAVVLHGKYRKTDEPGTLTLNRDFHDQVIDPGLLREIREMVAAGELSLDTLWDMLVAGELLAEDFDRDLERDRIAQDAAVRMSSDPVIDMEDAA